MVRVHNKSDGVHEHEQNRGGGGREVRSEFVVASDQAEQSQGGHAAAVQHLHRHLVHGHHPGQWHIV